MVAINASPEKIYLVLFVLVIIGYTVFIIMRTMKKSTVDVEHFVESNPDYQYRMEVIKVFDLYMNRNPTPDEIQKYAQLKNEQEILLAFLKDFNIQASDINKDKLIVAKEDTAGAAATDSFVSEETPVATKVVEDGVIDVELFQQDNIMVPIKAYLELKKKVEEFDQILVQNNKLVFEHYT